jgi:hypothetical protein
MTLDTPKEIELKARIDEIDAALFLLNSGVSESSIRTGFLERRREWMKQLSGRKKSAEHPQPAPESGQ